jgi:hypothetical protein
MRTKAMRSLAVIFALAVGISSVVVLSAKTLNILEDLIPQPQKKPQPGYFIEGKAYHYRDKRLDVRVSYLTADERRAWFDEREIKDPFSAVRAEDNYAFFKVRFENLQKDENVEFTPGSCMFGTGNLVDDITVYQMFYKETDGEERLAAAGKSFYFKALHLPPGQWIERLMIFQYDELYQQKKVSLVLSSILLGREGVDLEFPFLTTFKKEKQK